MVSRGPGSAQSSSVRTKVFPVPSTFRPQQCHPVRHRGDRAGSAGNGDKQSHGGESRVTRNGRFDVWTAQEEE